MLEILNSPPPIPENDAQAQCYLLLETEAVEDYLRIQPDAPNQPSLHEAVKKIDFTTITRWAWSDTEYGAHERKGPLLVQLDSSSPLISAFFSEWSLIDAGLLITTQASIDQVLAHLRAILFVYLPDGTKTRFRLQETLALSSVLRALNPTRAANLLGPLTELVWRENIGLSYQWWRFQHAGDADAIQGKFRFSQNEMAAIDTCLAERRLKEQVVLTQQAPHSFQGEPIQQTIDWINRLRAWGFQRHVDIAAALDIFRHPGFLSQTEVLAGVLQDTTITPAARITQAMNCLHEQGA